MDHIDRYVAARDLRLSHAMRRANHKGEVLLSRCRLSERMMFVAMLVFAAAPVAALVGYGVIVASLAILLFTWGYLSLLAEDALFAYFIGDAFVETDTTHHEWKRTVDSLPVGERYREEWGSPGTV